MAPFWFLLHSIPGANRRALMCRRQRSCCHNTRFCWHAEGGSTRPDVRLLTTLQGDRNVDESDIGEDHGWPERHHHCPCLASIMGTLQRGTQVQFLESGVICSSNENPADRVTGIFHLANA